MDKQIILDELMELIETIKAERRKKICYVKYYKKDIYADSIKCKNNGYIIEWTNNTTCGYFYINVFNKKNIVDHIYMLHQIIKDDQRKLINIIQFKFIKDVNNKLYKNIKNVNMAVLYE
jgi:hypothetical protein